MTTFAQPPVVAAPAAAPVRPMSVRPHIQRCGGMQCPPGTCDHAEEIQRCADEGVGSHTSQSGGSAVSALRFERVRVEPPDKSGTLRPMLRIGPEGDEFEREAERVAETILQEPGSSPDPGAATSPAVQRSAAHAGEAPVPASVRTRIDSLRGGGVPLPASVLSALEPRFGHDFSGVRIHTGIDAAQTARALSARAFTIGRDIVFAAAEYAPETARGRRLLAHELTHVVQQGAATSRGPDVVQRAGDPAAIPPGLTCRTSVAPGRPTGTDLLFPNGGSTISPAHTALLTTFLTNWVAGGGTDDVVVDGFASTEGEQAANWTLSCARAEAARTELVRLGIPAVRINVVAHGESTDFSPSRDPNQRVVVSLQSAGVLPLPLAGGLLTPRDNFAGRSMTRFGVGEIIDLSFFSLPLTPAAGFGGLRWTLVSGGGVLATVTDLGTATYTAPATAAAVQLELRVATGATAGRVVTAHSITIVIPSGIRITEVPGTAPNTHPTGPLPPGTWGAGFQGNVFAEPRDVSFQGVVFGEGTVAAVVTPPGSFLSLWAGLAHPANTFGPAHGGNATTGTPVSPPVDNISSGGRGPAHTLLGVHICGPSDFLWAIPWEFSVAGGLRTPFTTANHHATSTQFCDASIEKGGAGPFVRPI